MIRVVAKIVVGVIAGILALLVVVYVVALIINRHDEPPAESARRFDELYRGRPTLADEDNASVYMMGLDAPADEDPYAVGLRRIAWLREVAAGRPFDHREDPLRAPRNTYSNRPPAAQEFVTSCEDDRVRCVIAFAGAGAVVDQWTAADASLLPRYLELLAHSGWRDEFPDNVSVPLPAFGVAVEGQRLLLLSAYAGAERGDVAQVRAWLEADLGFWRGVLQSADMVITKMVAAGALKRHFEWGNLVLRRLPAGAAAAGVPAGWHVALTDSERSMRRTMTAEWLFVSTMLERFQFDEPPASWLDRAETFLLQPLYQPQDTKNRFADYYWSLSETFAAPLDGYPEALAQSAVLALEVEDAAFARPLYNIGGGIMLMDAYDFAQYAARVADIEGVRRAALAAVTLRDAGVAAPDVEAALRVGEFRNPYDDSALRWYDGAIVFRGLEDGVRGEHELHY